MLQCFGCVLFLFESCERPTDCVVMSGVWGFILFLSYLWRLFNFRMIVSKVLLPKYNFVSGFWNFFFYFEARVSDVCKAIRYF